MTIETSTKSEFLLSRIAIDILNTPPGSPSDEDTYLIDSSPTGAWVGHANEVACYDSGSTSWKFITPTAGDEWWVTNKDSIYSKSVGGSWRFGVVDANNCPEKTSPIAADVVQIADSADSFKCKKALLGNLPGGPQPIIQGSSETEATSTQTTPWATLKTINLTVAQKKYKVDVFFQYGCTVKDKCVFPRVQIDNTVTICTPEHEGKPDGWYMPCGASIYWDNTGGSAGSKPFDLDGYTQGGSIKVKNFRVLLTEVV